MLVCIPHTILIRIIIGAGGAAYENYMILASAEGRGASIIIKEHRAMPRIFAHS